MNNPHEIENLLRQMPLVKPSADLDERVADVLAAGAADSGAAGQETRRANTPDVGRANSSGRPHPMRAWLFGAVGGALAAAAAVILAVGLPQGANTVTPATKSLPAPVEVARGLPQPNPAAAPVEPVRFEQNWSELSYEGLVCPDPETPMQTFRRRTVDRVQFFDPQRNIRMETTVPREEIIFVKASMQ
jgi:hypothetical protein